MAQRPAPLSMNKPSSTVIQAKPNLAHKQSQTSSTEMSFPRVTCPSTKVNGLNKHHPMTPLATIFSC